MLKNGRVPREQAELYLCLAIIYALYNLSPDRFIEEIEGKSREPGESLGSDMSEALGGSLPVRVRFCSAVASLRPENKNSRRSGIQG